MTVEERFWKNVKKTDSCWLWTARGRCGSLGYGQFWLGYKDGKTTAHRAAWILTFGDPKDLYVLHKCDNPLCVNPDHLFLGTQQDNVRDCFSKGRGVQTSGFGIKEREKTHCPRGHEYTSENTYKNPNKVSRQCRTCKKEKRAQGLWK